MCKLASLTSNAPTNYTVPINYSWCSHLQFSMQPSLQASCVLVVHSPVCYEVHQECVTTLVDSSRRLALVIKKFPRKVMEHQLQCADQKGVYVVLLHKKIIVRKCDVCTDSQVGMCFSSVKGRKRFLTPVCPAIGQSEVQCSKFGDVQFNVSQNFFTINFNGYQFDYTYLTSMTVKFS